jgi:hypothetical protein
MMKVYAVYMHDHTGDHQIEVFTSEQERQDYIEADMITVVNLLSVDGYSSNVINFEDRHEVYAADGDIYYEWICCDTELNTQGKFTTFRNMDYTEVSHLKQGDKIAIKIGSDFLSAKVVRPMFWNSDADEPDWEVETDNGFVDVYSIYAIN